MPQHRTRPNHLTPTSSISSSSTRTARPSNPYRSASFTDRDFNYLYHYTEYPAIYDKERLVVQHMRGTRPGETEEQRVKRSGQEFTDCRTRPSSACGLQPPSMR